jgi:general secretion pathway protein D
MSVKPVAFKTLLFCFAMSLPLAGLVAPADTQAAEVVTQTSAPQTYAYVFKDADIAQVVEEILGNGLGVSYRLAPGVTGNMNFRIERRLTKAQLLSAFEVALNQYDIVMLREDETIIIRPRADAQVGARIADASTSMAKVGFQVRAVPIKYGSASEIAKALETLSREKLVLFTSDSLGLLLLGGNADELESAIKSIDLFDQNTLSDARIRYFAMRNADAQTVATDLDKILAQSGTTGVHLAPVKRLNGIFAFAKTAEVLDQIAPFVEKLDTPSQALQIRVSVYRPKGASADTLATTLNQVLGLSTSASGSEASGPSQSGGDSTLSASGVTNTTVTQLSKTALSTRNEEQLVSSSGGGLTERVVADRDSNSLIIAATDATRVRIMNVLGDIDRQATQIYIEASILEVTLNDEFSFGVDWSALKGAGMISNFTSSATGFAAAAPGLSVTYLKSDIKAAITALSSKSKVYVVSAPKITTRENTTASLKIGDQVPIIKQSSQSTTTANAILINSVDYKDTGVMLKVTPRVLAENRVALDVTQEVSSVAKTQTSGIDSPTIHQRRMESSLIVPEGTVVALGGLISSSESGSQNGAPGISRMPVIGNLFKKQARSSDRTELIVLLEVKIMRDDMGYAKVWDDLNADLKELSRDGRLKVR